LELAKNVREYEGLLVGVQDLNQEQRAVVKELVWLLIDAFQKRKLVTSHVWLTYMMDGFRIMKQLGTPRAKKDRSVGWSPLTISYFQTLRTSHFQPHLLRGPMGKGKGRADPLVYYTDVNFVYPSNWTFSVFNVAHTPELGVQALWLFLWLQTAAATKPHNFLVDTAAVKVIAASNTEDTMAVVPTISRDAVWDVLVGSLDPHGPKTAQDLLNGRTFDLGTLKSTLVVEMGYHVMSVLDRAIQAPVGMMGVPASKGSLEENLQKTKGRIRRLEMCIICLLRALKVRGVVAVGSETCCQTDYCNTCNLITQKYLKKRGNSNSSVQHPAACPVCLAAGQVYAEPQLRACKHCIDNKEKCVHSAISNFSVDLETANRLLLDAWRSAIEACVLESRFSLTVGINDATHWGKTLMQCMAKGFVWIHGELFNSRLCFLALFDDPLHRPTIIKLRVTIRDVLGRDRQDVAMLRRKSGLWKVLLSAGFVVVTILPDLFWQSDTTNCKELVSKPLAVKWCSPSGFLVMNHTGVDGELHLVSQMTSPVKALTLVKGIVNPVNLGVSRGVAFVLTRTSLFLVELTPNALACDPRKLKEPELSRQCRSNGIVLPDDINDKGKRWLLLKKTGAYTGLTLETFTRFL
jgi:hypothetical protein